MVWSEVHSCSFNKCIPQGCRCRSSSSNLVCLRNYVKCVIPSVIVCFYDHSWQLCHNRCFLFPLESISSMTKHESYSHCWLVTCSYSGPSSDLFCVYAATTSQDLIHHFRTSFNRYSGVVTVYNRYMCPSAFVWHDCWHLRKKKPLDLLYIEIVTSVALLHSIVLFYQLATTRVNHSSDTASLLSRHPHTYSLTRFCVCEGWE